LRILIRSSRRRPGRAHEENQQQLQQAHGAIIAWRQPLAVLEAPSKPPLTERCPRGDLVERDQREVIEGGTAGRSTVDEAARVAPALVIAEGKYACYTIVAWLSSEISFGALP
jgi:hypothetical protein